MEDSEKIIFVRDGIVEKIVKGYIVGDLKRMLEIPVIPDHDGNCNFPIALYTLTSISFLGYLVGDTGLENDWERINAYIDKMFSPSNLTIIGLHRIELTRKFRNGLAHEFFPKMAGVSRVNSELMTLSKEGYWVLDADILARMFIDSVITLEAKMVSETFCLMMFERYNAMQEKNLKLKDSPSTSTTFTSRSSGATTTTVPYEQIQGDQSQVNYSKGDTGVSGLPDNTKLKSSRLDS